MRSFTAVASLLIFRFLFKGQSLWVVLKWLLLPHLHVVGATLSFLFVIFFVVVVSDVWLLCFFRISAVKPIPVPYALSERSFNTCCRFFCCFLLLLTFTSTRSSYFFLYSFLYSFWFRNLASVVVIMIPSCRKMRSKKYECPQLWIPITIAMRDIRLMDSE